MVTFKYSSMWLAIKIYAMALVLHTIVAAAILTLQDNNQILFNHYSKWSMFVEFAFWGLFFSGITSSPGFVLLWILLYQLKSKAKDFHNLLGWVYASTMIMALVAASFFMLINKLMELPNLFFGLGAICCAVAVALQHKSLKEMWLHKSKTFSDVHIINSSKHN